MTETAPEALLSPAPANHRFTTLGMPLMLYALTFGAFAAAAILMPPAQGPASALASAIIGALIAMYLGFLLSGVEPNNKHITWLLVAGLVVDLIFNFLALRDVATIPLKGLANLGVLAAAAGAGLWVARGMQGPHYLIMAAVVGAITDIFSVYAGPTRHLVNTAVFPYVSYSWGLIGRGGVFPCVGMGDFIFLVLYFAGVRKFGLDQRKTLIAIAVSIVVGFLSTLLSPRGIPALPFMSVGLLAVNLRALKQMR